MCFLYFVFLQVLNLRCADLWNISQSAFHFTVMSVTEDYGSYRHSAEEYGSLPKISNTLNIRTPKIIAKYNFKMFP